MKKLIIFLLFSLICSISHTNEVEGFFGAAYTKFDDVEGYDSSGASARVKYNLYDSDKGFFIYSNFKGQSIINFDAIAGYAIRSTGDWFFEAGAGVAYSYYFGPGFGGVLSTGIELGDNWFLTLPLTFRTGGLSYLQISPMIGWSL